MSELLYIKYNSHRKPEYQISTRIISCDDATNAKISDATAGSSKKVIKKPLNEKAKAHMITLKNNYEMLKDYYKNIKMIPYVESGDGLEFDFLQGESVLEGINFERQSLEVISNSLIKIMDELLDVKEEFLCDFYETEKFKEIFPDCHPSGKAFTVCNLDSIFSNFIRTSEGTICIDYEWVLDFPVPVNFLRYRMLHYLYDENVEYLRDKASFDQFIDMIQLSSSEKALYADMEMKFQYMVHGENVKYIYLENYKKRMITSEKAFQLIDSKDEHIENLENQIEGSNNHIKNLENIISDRENVIENIKQENAELVTNLQEHSEKLKESFEQIHTRDEQILERDAQILALNASYQKLRRCIKNPAFGAYVLFNKLFPNVKAEIEAKKQRKAEQEEEDRIKAKEEADRLRFEELIKLTEGDYESWISRREAEYESGEYFAYAPLISIVVPVYNVEDRHLIPCIESIKSQTYRNWELILVDDCSTYENVRKTLKKKKRFNKNIKVIFREENGGISKCTNTGIEAANGEFIAFMDCDDTIAPFALYEIVKKLNEEEYDFVYSDEDKINDDGTRRHSPFFKPDWSPDTLMSYMYTSHLGVYRTEIVKKLNGCRSEYDGCQDYDLTLRFTELTDNVGHVPKVLYHWREREESTASNPESKSYVKERSEKCKKDALERRKQNGELEWLDEIYQYRVRYIPKGDAFVSIIIPSKDNPRILEQCLRTLRYRTQYKNYEITIVDNGSSETNKENYDYLAAKYKCRYHYEKNDFNFSYMCNTGARISKGDYYVFLNDDIEIIDGQWLDRMLGQAELSHTGAVGAKLLYPETTLIQHAGVISIESGPVHEFAKMNDEKSYYFNRNKLDFDVLAVTAACLLVKKDVFNEVGGFDENLAVAYNDIDLCFKIREAGYYNVIRNDAIMYHHESISRGDDAMDPVKFERLMNEQEKLYKKHPKFKGYDPYYNVNLVQTDCDFSVNYDMDNDYSVKVVDGKSYEIDDSIKYGIDIARHDWCTYIEGWAFKESFDNNINLDTKFLLRGDTKSYLLNTAPVRREDVVQTFSDENCISFCGCKTRISRNAIEKGDYELLVVCNGKLASKEKANENSVEKIQII